MLVRIFQLFVKQLAASLGDVEAASFKRTFYLLERLAVVKAFILLTDLAPELLLKLFDAFFGALSAAHSSSVVTHVLDIMCACIDESESVSTGLLDALLKYFVLPFKKDAPIAFKLAQNVVLRCAAHLAPPLAALLNGAIDGDAAARRSAVAGDYHELIYELNRLGAAAQPILLGVLPNLEKELTVEDAAVRLRAVQLLVRMFAAKSGALAQQYRPLFATFVRRFGDADAHVRQTMCDYAAKIAANHEHAAAAVVGELKERLRDTSEPVRLAAVKAVCDVSVLAPDRVPGALLAEVALRVRDKSQPLREQAIKGLAQLYAASRVDEGGEQAAWVASAVVGAFAGAAAADRAFVERTIAHRLVASDGSAAERAAELAHLVAQLDDKARRVFDSLVAAKHALRTDCALFFESAAGEPDAKLLARLLAALALGADRKDELARLRRNAGAAKALRALLDPHLPYAAIAATLDDLTTNKLPKSAPGGLLARDIASRISLAILPADGVVALLDSPATPAARHLLLLMAQHFPDTLATPAAFERLERLLDSDAPLAVDLLAAAAQCASAAQLPAAPRKRLERALKPLVADADRATAATTALCRLARVTDNADAADRALADLAAATCNAVTAASSADALAAALRAAAAVARCESELFVKTGTESMRLAVKTLRANDSAASAAAAAAAAAVLVGAYLAGRLAAESTQALSSADASLLDALLAPLDAGADDGDLDYDAALSGAPIVAVRLAAFDALLPLVRLRAVDQRVTPAQWRGIASLLRHADADVRRRLVDALSPVVTQRQVVALRYVALLAAVVGADPDKELREQARATLARAVEMRAALSKLATLPAAAKATFLPEYTLPWMAHLLAAAAAPRREMAPVLQGVAGAPLAHLATVTDDLLTVVLSAQHDFSFAWRVCVSAGRARDIAGGARYTQLVCELMAKQITKMSQAAASWKMSALAEDDVFLPDAVFEKSAAAAPPTILPASFVVPAKVRAVAAATVTPTKKKRAKAGDDDDDDDDDDDEDDDDAHFEISPKKRTKSKAVDYDDDDDDDDDIAIDVKTTPKKRTPAKSKRASYNDDDDDQEDDDDEDADVDDKVKPRKGKAVSAKQSKTAELENKNVNPWSLARRSPRHTSK